MNRCRVPRTSLSPVVALGLLFLPSLAAAQDLASFEKRITVKALDNGLTFVVCERPEAPVFSFFTYAAVGSAQEVSGITGIAHMFEHMAFKGTDVIGTNNFTEEARALERVEQMYTAYQAERQRQPKPDPARVAEAEKAWKDAIEAAGKYVVSNEFGDIVQRAGGVGLNAFTSADNTGYFYSLPSNRLELWAYLESERFLRPVFREFYKERDVVKEERRLGESEPIGRLIEQFGATAFTAHPYHHPTIGWMSDLDSFSATDARKFYDTFYAPSNMTVTVVGDVKASEVLQLAEKYFGRLPRKPAPAPLRTVEPPQNAEKEVRLHEEAQPIYAEGYHKPSAFDPDEAVYAAISDILSNGRVSRLYRSLVRDKKIAAFAGGFPGYPGTKYPNLFIFFAVPTPGHSGEEVRDAIRAEIVRLKTEDVTDEELRMVKTRAKANLIRGLGDNEGLAFGLGSAQGLHGDWRELFREVDRIDKVTKADIRRIANATFTDSNRTVGMIITKG